MRSNLFTRVLPAVALVAAIVAPLGARAAITDPTVAGYATKYGGDRLAINATDGLLTTAGAAVYRPASGTAVELAVDCMQRVATTQAGKYIAFMSATAAGGTDHYYITIYDGGAPSANSSPDLLGITQTRSTDPIGACGADVSSVAAVTAGDLTITP